MRAQLSLLVVCALLLHVCSDVHGAEFGPVTVDIKFEKYDKPRTIYLPQSIPYIAPPGLKLSLLASNATAQSGCKVAVCLNRNLPIANRSAHTLNQYAAVCNIYRPMSIVKDNQTVLSAGLAPGMYTLTTMLVQSFSGERPSEALPPASVCSLRLRMEGTVCTDGSFGAGCALTPAAAPKAFSPLPLHGEPSPTPSRIAAALRRGRELSPTGAVAVERLPNATVVFALRPPEEQRQASLTPQLVGVDVSVRIHRRIITDTRQAPPDGAKYPSTKLAFLTGIARNVLPEPMAEAGWGREGGGLDGWRAVNNTLLKLNRTLDNQTIVVRTYIYGPPSGTADPKKDWLYVSAQARNWTAAPEPTRDIAVSRQHDDVFVRAVPYANGVVVYDYRPGLARTREQLRAEGAPHALTVQYSIAVLYGEPRYDYCRYYMSGPGCYRYSPDLLANSPTKDRAVDQDQLFNGDKAFYGRFHVTVSGANSGSDGPGGTGGSTPLGVDAISSFRFGVLNLNNFRLSAGELSATDTARHVNSLGADSPFYRPSLSAVHAPAFKPPPVVYFRKGAAPIPSDNLFDLVMSATPTDAAPNVRFYDVSTNLFPANVTGGAGEWSGDKQSVPTFLDGEWFVAVKPFGIHHSLEQGASQVLNDESTDQEEQSVTTTTAAVAHTVPSHTTTQQPVRGSSLQSGSTLFGLWMDSWCGGYADAAGTFSTHQMASLFPHAAFSRALWSSGGSLRRPALALAAADGVNEGCSGHGVCQVASHVCQCNRDYTLEWDCSLYFPVLRPGSDNNNEVENIIIIICLAVGGVAVAAVLICCAVRRYSSWQRIQQHSKDDHYAYLRFRENDSRNHTPENSTSRLTDKSTVSDQTPLDIGPDGVRGGMPVWSDSNLYQYYGSSDETRRHDTDDPMSVVTEGDGEGPEDERLGSIMDSGSTYDGMNMGVL